MSTIVDYLTKGGIPDAGTVQSLSWLAQAHRRFATRPGQTPDLTRANWHQRWAALIEDVLETRRGENH